MPNTAPTNLNVVEKDSTSITLNWRPVIGPVSGYKIKYKKAGNSQYAYIEVSHWEVELQGKMTDLMTNTAYKIQVAAYTEDGMGPYSEEITEKTKSGKFMFKI